MKSLIGLLLTTGLVFGKSTHQNATHPKPEASSRLSQISSMYGWEGFVYDLEGCPSESTMTSQFRSMVSRGARVVMPTLYCDGQDTESYYASVLTAAASAGIKVMPCIWTLTFDGQTFDGTIVPRINAWTKAVLGNPNVVLAVALGDEPLYDWDFGDPDTLAQYITNMKQTFNNAGQSIPVSISDLAYGWQQAGDTSSVQSAVDFYMINNFPYFAQNAQSGNSASSWTNFQTDMNYFKSIAGGKPLLVTQTGWPSNENLYAPNSPDVVATVASEQAYWNLLDGHCSDYFKANKVGWMWRAWDDHLDGWGVKSTSQTDKWSWSAKQTC